MAAEAAARELGELTLVDALALTVLLAEQSLARFDRAAVRWHGRFELERPGVSLFESQFEPAALAAPSRVRRPRGVLGHWQGCSSAAEAARGPFLA